MKKYNLSQHAKDVLKEREISIEWLERVLFNPELTEADSEDNELEHRLGRISEYGNRALRVVLNKELKPIKIVTVYFDRKKKDKL